MAAEEERQRLEREKAFDTGLIGPGDVVAPEAGPIVLMNHPEERGVMGDSDESLQIIHAFDHNVPIVVEQEGLSDSLPVMGRRGCKFG